MEILIEFYFIVFVDLYADVTFVLVFPHSVNTAELFVVFPSFGGVVFSDYFEGEAAVDSFFDGEGDFASAFVYAISLGFKANRTLLLFHVALLMEL